LKKRSNNNNVHLCFRVFRGQVFILDALAKYEPSAKDAEEIIERVTPRLKHANSAVSMSAIKVIMKYLDYIKNEQLKELLINEKLPPPLITLLSEHKPEIQYVALRNINLIVQKQPNILANGVKHFFVKYNDPIYVKMEKLEIMIKLASVKNIEKVLMEFKEYASEVDVDFVRKAVLAIGRCAIKIDKAAEKCIQVLLDLIQTKVNYVVQEAIIVIRDIFRKYPNRYESIIATLCENLESLDEPEAKAAMIWIIGEYSDRIDNAPELLENFVTHFDDEQAQVQLQLLTAVVKLFLKRPEDAKELVGQVLNLATSNADNPDLRDRGYVYWRLLSTDPEAAQSVVLAPKPTISDDTFQLDSTLLDNLMSQISTLSSVYHKPPEFFIKDHKTVKRKDKGEKKQGEEEESEEEESEEEASENEQNEEVDQSEEDEEEGEESDEEGETGETSPKTVTNPSSGKSSAAPLDILGMSGLMDNNSNGIAANNNSNNISNSAASSSSSGEAFKVVLSAEQGKGLQLRTRPARRNGRSYIDMTFDNNTNQALSQFAVKFNDNFVGVIPDAPITVGSIPTGQTKSFSLPLNESKQPSNNQPGIIQVAIKTELGIFYFNQPFSAHHLFTEDGKLPDSEFLNQWKTLPAETESVAVVNNRTVENVEELKSRFASANIFFIASRTVNNSLNSYFSFKYRNSVLLLEIKIEGPKTTATIKSNNSVLKSTALLAIQKLLTE
jgi:AP-1 complex subunit beta-1